MKKSVILSIIFATSLIVLFGIFFGKNLFEKEKIDNLFEKDEGIIKQVTLGLGDLCGTVRSCETYCSENQFACEVYCVKNLENSFCKERFSSIETDPHSLMKFPEFRNYNYTFIDGKLIEREPEIQNIGIFIDYYDPTTNKAGDFEFTRFVAHQSRRRAN